MDNRVNIFSILKAEGKLEKILVYPATKTIEDPIEKTTIKTFLNPLPIYGYVRDVSIESIVWKYYGQLNSGSKQVILEKKNETLIKIAQKIKIGNNYYKVYDDDTKGFGIQRRRDYIIAILKLKETNVEQSNE